MAGRKPKATTTAVIESPVVETIEVPTDIIVDSPVIETPTIEFDMGEFAVAPHANRQYASVYFGIRSLYGQAVRLRDKAIDWKSFTPMFEQCFGSIEERRFSMQQLSEFAWDYFQKTTEEVIAHNEKCLARMREEKIDEVEGRVEIEMPKPKPKVKPVIDMDDIPY